MLGVCPHGLFFITLYQIFKTLRTEREHFFYFHFVWRYLIEIQFNITMFNLLQKDQQSQKQQISYQNVTLPEPVYDQVYTGRQPIPVALRDVKVYVKQVQQEIEKLKEENQVPSDILDFPLHCLCFLNISECIRGPNSIEIKYIIK